MSSPRKPVYLDGKLTTYNAIRSKFKVSFTTINRSIEKFGRDLPSSAFKQAIVKLPPARHVEDRAPGWAERKYFPNAGNNGFSGGREHSGRTAVHSVSLHGNDQFR